MVDLFVIAILIPALSGSAGWLLREAGWAWLPSLLVAVPVGFIVSLFVLGRVVGDEEDHG